MSVLKFNIGGLCNVIKERNRVLWATFIVIAFIPEARSFSCKEESGFGTKEFQCPKYFDDPDEIYCCGTKRNLRCCNYDELHDFAPGLAPLGIGLLVFGLMAFIFIVIISCLCCSFCPLAKKRALSRRGHVIITTQPQQPVQAGYPAAPPQYPAAPPQYPAAPPQYPAAPPQYPAAPPQYPAAPPQYPAAPAYSSNPPAPGFVPQGKYPPVTGDNLPVQDSYPLALPQSGYPSAPPQSSYPSAPPPSYGMGNTPYNPPSK